MQEITQSEWAFILVLAAVINGLGIVRLLGGLGEYLRSRSSVRVAHYGPYVSMALFQLLTHVLLWWSILSLRVVGRINFLTYLYLLAGPTVLLLATSQLVPDVGGSRVDLREQYFAIRRTYYTLLAVFWLWAAFLWPAFGHPFAPTLPLILVWLMASVILSLVRDPRLHAAGAVGHLLLYVAFVGLYAMQLGEVGRRMTEQ